MVWHQLDFDGFRSDDVDHYDPRTDGEFLLLGSHGFIFHSAILHVDLHFSDAAFS